MPPLLLYLIPALRRAFRCGPGLLLLLLASPAVATEPATAPATLSASSTVGYTNSMEVLDDKRMLGVGDRVSFRVIQDRKEPISLVVTDSGEMEVPLIGRIQAADRTCKQLAYAIKAALDKTYFYHSTVILGLDSVSVKSKGRVYLTGQIRTQGPLEIPADETLTLSKAILRAGGLSDFANPRKIRLLRKSGPHSEQTQTIYVNLDDIMHRGQTDKDPVLKPDDLIVVPERLINFF